MSYILDALKKSERERRRGSVPDSLTIQETTPQLQRRRILWPYLIIATLALNALVFAFWNGLFHPKPAMLAKSAPVKQESATEKESLLPLAGQGEDRGAMKEILNHEENHPTSGAMRRNDEKGGDRKKSVETDPGSVKAAADKAIPPGSSADRAGIQAANEPKTQNAPAPVPNRLYNLSELPLSVRQNLPDLSVSVSLYSDDAASRLARINGTMMKEGQYLSTGLKLEEIIPAGVVFSYQNYRFLVGPK